MEAVLNQAEDRDFERQIRLEEERAKDERREGEMARRVSKRLMRIRNSIPHVGSAEGGLMSFVAVVADIIDYLVVGSIPIVGDILDVAVWFMIAIWVWSRGIKRPTAAMFSGIIELIPFGDLLPTFIGMVLVIIIYNNSRRKLAVKNFKGALEKIKNRGDS